MHTRLLKIMIGAAVTALSSAGALAPAVHADNNYLDNLPPNWAGTWTSGGMDRPASLTLSSSSPVTGEIDIPGVCHAVWNEVTRMSDASRVVAAHVTSGPCFDNTWNVTLGPTSVSGSDPVHNAGFTFRPNGIDRQTGQPVSVGPTQGPDCQKLADDYAAIPPGTTDVLDAMKATDPSLGKIEAGTLASCGILAAASDPSTAGSNPQVFTGFCKGIESLAPFDLAHDFVCGTPAG